MTDGTTDVLPLGKKQKYACNIVMGALLIAAGIILTLAGCNVIKASVRSIAAPTLLFAFGVAILLSAIIAKNSLSMWVAGVLIACGLATLLTTVTTASAYNIFPLYIAAPGIGCLFALCFAQVRLALIKAIVIFGGIAAVFSLASSGACGWGLTAGILAAFVGLCIIFFAVTSYLKKDNEEDA